MSSLDTATIVGLAGGAIIAGITGYGLYRYLTTGVKSGSGFLLQIQPGPNGTTNPAPSASGISEAPGKIVTITAIPDSGYNIGQWIVDGESVGSTASITVTMNMDHTVLVTFVNPSAPTSVPYAIVPAASQVVIGYYGCTITLAALNAISNTRIDMTDANWNIGGIAEFTIVFKVIDQYGNGVPNVPVTLYPNLFPDYSKYQGYLILNDQMIDQTNPLIMNSDANGNVTVNLSYYYGLTDEFKTLCKDAGLYVDGIIDADPLPATFTPYNGWNGTYDDLPVFFIKKGGEKTIPASPTVNTVIAFIPGTAIPQASAIIYCQFNAKML